LVVSDDSGARCAAATDNVAVRVNAPPIADAGPDREAFLGGAHDAILFDASGSSDPDQDPLSFIWDLGDGSRKAGARVYHSYARPGRYVVKLLVDDGTASSCGKVVDEAVVEAKTRTADG
jgi:PKD repeat protein